MSFSTANVLLEQFREQIDKLENEQELHDQKLKKLESENKFMREEIESYQIRQNLLYDQRDELLAKVDVLTRRVEELEACRRA
jgi:hypothetical protein